VHDQLRGNQLKSLSAGLPPVMGNFLMSGNDHVSVGMGRQIADYRGFNIDLCFHN
jgi:hypothetical protein